MEKQTRVIREQLENAKHYITNTKDFHSSLKAFLQKLFKSKLQAIAILRKEIGNLDSRSTIPSSSISESSQHSVLDLSTVSEAVNSVGIDLSSHEIQAMMGSAINDLQRDSAESYRSAHSHSHQPHDFSLSGFNADERHLIQTWNGYLHDIFDGSEDQHPALMEHALHFIVEIEGEYIHQALQTALHQYEQSMARLKTGLVRKIQEQSEELEAAQQCIAHYTDRIQRCRCGV